MLQESPYRLKLNRLNILRFLLFQMRPDLHPPDRKCMDALRPVCFTDPTCVDKIFRIDQLLICLEQFKIIMK
jgi:hypothetical protein